ncbi:sensor domain-containing protein [Piscibacillus sp. B03]|uniref:sensor domain-containing protein n=1 Tax=Piscibacillus sp. B03 TaxID=3457430 RepID=UPI003FCCE523
MSRTDFNKHKLLQLSQYNQAQKDLYKRFPDGIVTVDRTGIIVDTNQQLLDMLCYDREDLVNQHFKPFIVKEFQSETLNYFNRVLTGQSVKHYTSVIHKYGYEVTVRLTSVPIFEQDKVIGMYALVHDLSETERDLNDLFNVKEKLISVQATADIGSWEVDLNTNTIHWSDQVYEIYERPEWREATLDLEGILTLTHPKDYDHFRNTVLQAMEYGTSFELDYRIKTRSGVRTLHTRGDSILDNQGTPVRLIGIVQDVTKVRGLERDLTINRERLQKIYDSLDMIVCSFNLDNRRLEYVSKGIERMINVEVEQVYQNDFNWETYIHPEDLASFSRNRRQILRGEKVKHEYRITSKTGQIKWVEEQAIPIFDENGNITQIDGVLVDFTERKLHEQEMEFIANHDHLTGLKNRRNFEAHAQKLMSKRKKVPFWLIYLDLDNFKSINDSLGHDIGDQVLTLTATRLNNIIEDRGVCARLNGDEFVILVHQHRDGETIQDIAQRLKVSLERIMLVDEYQLQVTSSIGISHFPTHGNTLNDLINNADRAVHYVKMIGKNSWQIFEDDVEKRTFNDYELEQDLHFAIEKDQLELYLQPILNNQLNQVPLAEALIRWKHPKYGYIPPNVFIPIAEKSGLIHQIDHFVLRQTCETISRWKSRFGTEIAITNNLSPKRFLRHSFKNYVLDTLDYYQVDASQIIFEITETTLIHDYAVVNETINEFREIGFRFALDDFGTGYSSIAHLSLFNIDLLKIDRQFIRDIDQNTKNQAILRGISHFTNELEIPMVAEGIETEDELEFLQTLDCNYYQGFYFKKPCSVGEFEEYYG